jgi:hypothetical protein
MTMCSVRLGDLLRQRLGDVVGCARVDPEIGRERLERVPVARDRIPPFDQAVRPVHDEPCATSRRHRSGPLGGMRLLSRADHRECSHAQNRDGRDPGDESKPNARVHRFPVARPARRKRREGKACVSRGSTGRLTVYYYANIMSGQKGLRTPATRMGSRLAALAQTGSANARCVEAELCSAVDKSVLLPSP